MRRGVEIAALLTLFALGNDVGWGYLFRIFFRSLKSSLKARRMTFMLAPDWVPAVRG